jgi:Cof subfamily protein (haloacid dehalogenase superfamily)/HAD superfamily hydrolase (TIGR01509 family)
VPIRLLIADVDGTIVTKKKLVTPRALEAVEKMRARGILFAVTTGRPARGVASLSKALRLTTPIAAFNGGALVRPDLEVIEERTLSLAVATEVVTYLQESGIDLWLYSGADWYIPKPELPHLEKEKRNVAFEPILIEDLRPVLGDVVKIVGVCDDTLRLATVEAELRRRVGAEATAVRSQPYFLDVTHADANKGTVVRLNSLFHRIPLDEIAVIGDMMNDILMFGVAGTSIAMGNSSPEVQRAARYVTTSNEEEGFANAVDWFVLGHKRKTPPTLGLPRRVRACLFDLDGVLTRTAELHAAAWKETCDAILRERSPGSGQPVAPFDLVADYAQHVEGRSSLDGARAFLGSRGLPAQDQVVTELARRKDALLLKLLRARKTAIHEGAIRYVRELRKAGVKTAVVTSSAVGGDMLASAGIAELFDARIDGGVAAKERLAGRPAPDMLHAAARALGVAPNESAVFECALSGAEAGRAGRFFYVVGVDRGGRAAELYAHGADAVVSDVAEMLEPQ